MAETRGRFAMERRLLIAGLLRRRGTVGLAVLAVAIGASVASALINVSSDVSRKLTHELRALGPNLLLLPAAAGEYLDADGARARLAASHLDGTPILYVVGRDGARPVPLAGADLAAARRLHPGWTIGRGSGAAAEVAPANWIGARLARRLDLAPGSRVQLGFPGSDRGLDLTVGAVLEAGGPDDEAWWIPLADAQRLAGLAGRASLVQTRIPAGADAGAAVRALEAGGGIRATVIHALSATEAGLLTRMRRLMALVTVAALVAAGLCAFGTLTDLALERRRDIALMKALGARRRDILRQLAAESVVIGLAGGLAGWMLGAGFAELIGARVFFSAIALRGSVLFAVLGLSLLVAVLAGLGPLRLALAVQPARALQGD